MLWPRWWHPGTALCTICHPILNPAGEKTKMSGKNPPWGGRRTSREERNGQVSRTTSVSSKHLQKQGLYFFQVVFRVGFFFFASVQLKGRALGGAGCCGCIIWIDIKCILETKSSLACTATSINISLKIWNEGTKLRVWCLEVLSSHSKASCASEEYK